ncbi:MAG: GNAT family N-acetyltransferase [Ardenticatenaceae bacterium]|nr:GNAT family N-acetyltransferase [Ardenticatenaceae bacterium]
MQQLTQTDFAKVRPLFAALAHNLTIESILQGLTPGQVWVDDVAAPETAVCWYGHRLYLAGSAGDLAVQEAFRQLFRDIYIPAAQAQDKNAYVLHATSAWQQCLPTLLADWQPIARGRLYYRLHGRGHDWTPHLPPGYTLRPVDASLLADTTLTNLDWVTEEMASERPSLADFLAKSFGYCLQHEDKIVAWCMSEYNTGKRCELGIATDDAHQRKGLATAVASATIQHALSHDIDDIGWVCWKDNAASIASAHKLGFTLVDDGSAWFGFFERVIHLAVQGNLCFQNQDYAGAAAWYEQALHTDSTAPTWVTWNAACAYARLGETTPAFTYLRQAIAAGFDDRQHLLTSPHWQPYHDTPQWTAILQSLA